MPDAASGRDAGPRADRPPIHPTNAWNPTGRSLLPLPGTRLYYVVHEGLDGPRTSVFLGSQQHLTFVADWPDEVPAGEIRERLIAEHRLYPHLVDGPADAEGER